MRRGARCAAAHRRQPALRWAALVALVPLAVLYVLYARRSAFTHGGSPEGIAYGVLAPCRSSCALVRGAQTRLPQAAPAPCKAGSTSTSIWLLAAVTILFHPASASRTRWRSPPSGAAGGVASGLWGPSSTTTPAAPATPVEGDLTPRDGGAAQQLARTMARLSAGRSSLSARCARAARRVGPRRFAGWRLRARGRAAAQEPRRAAPWANDLPRVQPLSRTSCASSRPRAPAPRARRAAGRPAALPQPDDVWL